MRRRGDLKVVTLVYKCLHSFSSTYHIDDCLPQYPVGRPQNLRSADSSKLFVSKTSTNFELQSFAVFGSNLPTNCIAND